MRVVGLMVLHVGGEFGKDLRLPNLQQLPYLDDLERAGDLAEELGGS